MSSFRMRGWMRSKRSLLIHAILKVVIISRECLIKKLSRWGFYYVRVFGDRKKVIWMRLRVGSNKYNYALFCTIVDTMPKGKKKRKSIDSFVKNPFLAHLSSLPPLSFLLPLSLFSPVIPPFKKLYLWVMNREPIQLGHHPVFDFSFCSVSGSNS